jgi:cytochrome c-type biogenesis protein CcmF
VVVGVRARRRATAEAVPVAALQVVRGNPRLYGGLLVHVGVIVLAMALVTTSGYTTKREVLLAPGQSTTVRGFTVTYLQTRTTVGAQKTTIAAAVQVRRGSDNLGTFHPAISSYPNFPDGIGTPAIHSDPWHDVYLTLVSAPNANGGSGPVTLGVQVGTFVMWLWIGGAIMALGILVALTPTRRRRRPALSTSAVHDEPRELAEAAT